MAKREILAGATDQTIDVFIMNNTSSTGSGLTGLVFNSAGLTCYYRKGATGTMISLSLVTQTVSGTHTDGGFAEIDVTNAPGMYRLDLSDTVVAAKPYVTVFIKGAANMAPLPVELQIVGYDPFDGTRLGLTALPNAAAAASGGLFIRGTGAGAINQTANGMVDVNVVRVSDDATAADNLEAILDGTGGTNLTVADLVIQDDLIVGDDFTVAGDMNIAGSLIMATGMTINGTSNEAQTGDNFARIGAPAGASVSADIAALNNLSAAQVKAEVVVALATDTYAEPGQGAVAATASLKDKIGYLHKAARNRKTQDSALWSLYSDNGTTVDQKSTVSDNGTIAERAEVVSGP